MMPDWVFDDDDRRFMDLAIREARSAAEVGEVPVGAVVVRDGEVVASAGNRRQAAGDPTGHAELVALRLAGSRGGDWRLVDHVVYVTLEPCAMCTAAMRQARVSLVVWGTCDEEAGACGSRLDLAGDPRLGPPLAHRGGLEAGRCRSLLRSFFENRRRSS